MAIETMRDLLIESVRDLYDAEKQAVRAYPRLKKAASSESLQAALEQHLEETKKQVERLEQVFEKLELRPRGRHCEGIAGLIAEAREMIDEDLTPPLLDVALVALAQKVEHYEIASYGSARAFAETLGLADVARLLDATLAEEKATDQKLNKLAVSEINRMALEAEEQEGEEEERQLDRAAAGNKPRRARKR